MNTFSRQRLLNAQLIVLLILSFFSISPAIQGQSSTTWVVDKTEDWKQNTSQASGVTAKQHVLQLTEDSGTYRSRIRTFSKKRSPDSLTLKQSRAWTNWTLKKGISPGGGDAPVFLVAGKNDYWYLNASSGGGPYHAWHSTDMKNWTAYPEAVGVDWVTSAEYADGTFYIYYDEPNDEDPHLIMDDDLTDEKHQKKGEVFADPSHGSDSGIFRAADGTFHLIYEDWSDINAAAHNWDSELAGHADSPDGIHGFKPHEHPPFIDERGKKEGDVQTYNHPNGTYRYQPRAEPIDAFGDYSMIRVGSTYYLFCDYDPHEKPIGLGYWYGSSLTEAFDPGGMIAEQFHPDPSVGFAEGQFYLFAQRKGGTFVSPGPWTPTVRARAGVDQNGNGSIDEWTSWQTVREEYRRKPGFSKIIETTNATLDLSELPSGTGVRFELKLEQTGAGKPKLDRAHVRFSDK